MATFVLVHGAWHGSWCWKRVRAPRLLRSIYSLLCVPMWPGTSANGMFGMPSPTEVAAAWRMKPSHTSEDEG